MTPTSQPGEESSPTGEAAAPSESADPRRRPGYDTALGSAATVDQMMLMETC